MDNATRQRLLANAAALAAARDEYNRRERDREVPEETMEQTAARMAGRKDGPSRTELAEKYGYDDVSDDDELRDMYPREV